MQTIYKYASFHSKKKSHFVPSTRGAGLLITDVERTILNKAFDAFRAKGVAITASLFAAVARGIVKRKRPTDFGGRIDGLMEFSDSWAREEMKRCGMMIRAATTDRTIAAATIVQQGRIFYEAVAQHKPARPQLLYNVDEFFFYKVVVSMPTGHGNALRKERSSLYRSRTKGWVSP